MFHIHIPPTLQTNN